MRLNIFNKEITSLSKDIDATLIQALGGAFLFITAYLTWRNLKTTEDKQVTELFSKAIEQIGNADIHVRIGAIYTLERIAKDSQKDYWQVIEILTAYVREKALHLPQAKKDTNLVSSPISSNDTGLDIPDIPTDIQAILTVLSRRTKTYRNGEEYPLDLSKSDLRNANLDSANLNYASLKDANLEQIHLKFAQLSHANMKRACLKNAILESASLESSILENSILEGSYLLKAKLMNANLCNANLKDTYLLNANLKSADLTGANLENSILWGTNLKDTHLENAKNLTPEQVRQADNWKKAHYNSELREKLGLSRDEG